MEGVAKIGSIWLICEEVTMLNSAGGKNWESLKAWETFVSGAEEIVCRVMEFLVSMFEIWPVLERECNRLCEEEDGRKDTFNTMNMQGLYPKEIVCSVSLIEDYFHSMELYRILPHAVNSPCSTLLRLTFSISTEITI